MSEGECLGIQSQNCRGILIEGRGRERTEQGVVATLTEWHACLLGKGFNSIGTLAVELLIQWDV